MNKCCGFIVVLLALLPTVLRAADREIDSLPAMLSGDTLIVNFPVAGFITSEDSAAIVNGEALSIVCRLELWQKRRLWFDRLRSEISIYADITFDRWGEEFVSSCYGESRTETVQRHAQLDSLVTGLGNDLQFRFLLQPSDYSKESYLAYSLELQYLTPEKISDLKDWLFSGSSNPDHKSEANHQSLPNKIINLALSSTGLRNRSYRQSSLSFHSGQITGDIMFSRPVN